jgi:hypothetical protein
MKKIKGIDACPCGQINALLTQIADTYGKRALTLSASVEK